MVLRSIGRSFQICLIATLLVGCGAGREPPTLVVHYHDDVYDLIDHGGNIVATAGNLDEVERLSKKPQIKALIRGNRVVARFAGVPTPDGLTVPVEIHRLMSRLIQAEVMQMDYEYTNDPSP